MTEREQADIDTDVAHAARVYDYLLGGTANFSVDRDAAARAWPTGLERVRADARAHRGLLRRISRYLVVEAGIRQFLDIGTGIPRQDDVHEVARREARQASVVYVDRDPIVLAQAHEVLRGVPDDMARYIYGDLNEPKQILAEAAAILDFSRPVAVMMFGVLHFLTESDGPQAVVAELNSALAPGSYIALTHLARDVGGDATAQPFRRLNAAMKESIVLRTRDEITGLFDGLALVEPGVVILPKWRPDPGGTAAESIPIWCGVACKPG